MSRRVSKRKLLFSRPISGQPQTREEKGSFQRMTACCVIILEKANQPQGWGAKPRTRRHSSCESTVGRLVAGLPKGCWLPAGSHASAARAACLRKFSDQREVDCARLSCLVRPHDGGLQATGTRIRVPDAVGGQLPGAISFLTAPVNLRGFGPKNQPEHRRIP